MMCLSMLLCMRKIPVHITKIDLKLLHAWSDKWKMVFNPDVRKPAEQVIFTNRNSTSYDTLSYSGIDIKSVLNHKHLGFVLDSKLDYTEHIDAKIAKANQGIGILCSETKTTNINLRNFATIMVCHLLNGIPLW